MSSQFIVTQAMAAQVAALLIQGVSHQTIARRLSEELKITLTHRNIRRVAESEECKEILADIGNSAVANAKTKIRQELAVLVPLVVDTIRHHLEEKNLMAIAPALKILGFDTEEKATQATQIVVQLPDTGPKHVEEIGNGDSEEPK